MNMLQRLKAEAAERTLQQTLDGLNSDSPVACLIQQVQDEKQHAQALIDEVCPSNP